MLLYYLQIVKLAQITSKSILNVFQLQHYSFFVCLWKSNCCLCYDLQSGISLSSNMVSIHKKKKTETVPMEVDDQSEKYVPNILRISSEDLKKKADGADDIYESCVSCGRRCEDNRQAGKLGKCNTGMKATVSSHFPHFGEEDCLKGWKGSGTIFFTNCNLKCIFCQNYDISQEGQGYDCEDEEIADMMMELQKKGCHNINFVSPTHVIAPIIR